MGEQVLIHILYIEKVTRNKISSVYLVKLCSFRTQSRRPGVGVIRRYESSR